MSHVNRTTPATGNHSASDNGRGTTTAAGQPDPKKEVFLTRLHELRSWLGRRYATFVRPCADRAAIEDLTRLVNIIANSESTGHTNVALVWSMNSGPPAEPLPSENWLG
jgi:hypothetical protein